MNSSTVLFIAMALIAVGFIVFGCLFARSVIRAGIATKHSEENSAVNVQGVTQRQSTNVALYKSQMEELTALHERGDLDKDALQALIAEAEVQLLLDVDHPLASSQGGVANNSAAIPNVSDFGSFALVLFLMLLFTGWLYFPQGLGVGAIVDWRLSQHLDALKQSTDLEFRKNELRSVIGLIESNPVSDRDTDKRAGVLYLQADAYAALGQHRDSVSVYRRLLATQPDNPNLMAQLAKAIYLRDINSAQQSPNRLDNNNAAPDLAVNAANSEVVELLDKVLASDSLHEEALRLRGMLAFGAGDYAIAIQHWQKALQQPSMQQINAEVLLKGIQTARERLGSPIVANKGVDADNSTVNALVSLRIEIDPSLIVNDDPDSPVFVFARAISGPPMPLAAKRLKLSDLPTDLDLSNLDSMAGPSLSGQRSVTVVARLSRSGQPQAKTGDIQSPPIEIEVRSPGQEKSPVLLLIDQRIP